MSCVWRWRKDAIWEIPCVKFMDRLPIFIERRGFFKFCPHCGKPIEDAPTQSDAGAAK